MLGMHKHTHMCTYMHTQRYHLFQRTAADWMQFLSSFPHKFSVSKAAGLILSAQLLEIVWPPLSNSTAYLKTFFKHQ